MPINIDSPLARRVATFVFLGGIFGLTFWVLSPFFASLAWAGILAYVTWPLHLWVRRHLPHRDNLAALLMTLGVAATLLLPMLWVLFTLVGDVATASVILKRLAAEGLPPLPAGVREWPAGDWLIAQYQRVQGDPEWIRVQMAALGLSDAMALKALAGGVGRNVAKFGLAVFALFFLFRHGDSVLSQFRGAVSYTHLTLPTKA